VRVSVHDVCVCVCVWCSPNNNLELNRFKIVEMMVFFRRNSPVESFWFLRSSIPPDLK